MRLTSHRFLLILLPRAAGTLRAPFIQGCRYNLSAIQGIKVLVIYQVAKLIEGIFCICVTC